MRLLSTMLLSIVLFSVSAQNNAPNAFDAAYQAGVELYNKQDFSGARKSFEEAEVQAVKFYGKDSYPHRNALWYLVWTHIQLSDDKAAKRIYEATMSLKVAETDESKKGLTQLTENMGDYFTNRGNYSEAIRYYKIAVRQHQQNGSATGEDYYKDLKNILDFSYDLGKRDSMHYYFSMIADALPIIDNRYAVNIRNWVGFSFGAKSMDVSDQIEKRCETYLRTKEEANQLDASYSSVWTQYGRLQRAKGQTERALKSFGEARKVILTLPEGDRAQLVDVLFYAIETSNQSKKFDGNTAVWATELEQVNEKLLASNPKDYSENLVPVFMYYFYTQQYLKAEAVIEKMLPVYAKAVGKDNPDYKMMELSYRGVIEKTGHTDKLKSLADPKLTEQEAMKALNLQNGGEQIEQLGKSIQQGDYLKAITIFEQHGKLFTDYYNSINDHETEVQTLLTIGSLYRETGNYVKAEAIYRNAENVAMEKLPDTNFTKHRALASVAVFLQYTGQYREAERRLLSAIQMLDDSRTKTDSLENDKVYYEMLSGLGSLYAAWGYHKEAEDALLDVLRYLRRFHKEDSQEVVLAKIDVADLYRVMQYFSWAEMLYKECDAPMKKIYGENNVRYITFLNSFGANYLLRGKYREAEPMYVKSRDFYLKHMGSKSQNYIGAVTDLAMMYFHMGEIQKAKEHYRILNELLLYKTDNFFPALSEKEKTSFYNATARSLNTYSSFALTYGQTNPSELNELYDLLLLTKGMLFKATDKMRVAVNNSKDDSLKYLYSRWINSKNELSRVYQMTDPQKKSAGVDERKMEMAANALEKRISTRSELFTNIISKRASWKAIKPKLKPNEAAVEIVRIRNAKAEYVFSYIGKGVSFDTIGADGFMRVTEIPSDRCAGYKAGIREWDVITSLNGQTTKGKTNEQLSALMAISPLKLSGKHSDGKEFTITLSSDSVFRREFMRRIVYAALIITPGQENVQLALLPNGDQLESRYAKYYTNMIKTHSTDQYSYQQFWQPIKAKLGNATKVYLSPDGIYNSINLNTLYNTASGKYVIDETEINIVSNTSDILVEKTRSKIHQAVLVGFPDYYLKSSGKGSSPAADTTYTILAKDTTQRFMNGSTITDLPGTNVEVNAIESVMKPLKYDVKKYVSAEATEERLKTVKAPSILHIATHGFFLSDVEENSGGRSITGVTDKKLRENPLLRSGLLLAGSGKTIAGQHDNQSEDGILTAYEAMNLDLNNTDLVVMSACETGLGEVKSGEGVYGLQRAFRAAGAQSVLMSLWKVDDKATQELMSGFYQQWLTTGNKQSSFRDIQLKIRDRFSHPYYWGAFVMVGL